MENTKEMKLSPKRTSNNHPIDSTELKFRKIEPKKEKDEKQNEEDQSQKKQNILDNIFNSFNFEKKKEKEENSNLEDNLDFLTEGGNAIPLKLFELFEEWNKEVTETEAETENKKPIELDNLPSSLPDKKQKIKKILFKSKTKNYSRRKLRSTLPKRCTNEKCEQYFENSEVAKKKQFSTLSHASTCCSVCGSSIRYFYEGKWFSSANLSTILKKK